MVAALLITNAPRDRSNWTTEAVPVFMPTADEGNRGLRSLSNIFDFEFLIFDLVEAGANRESKIQNQKCLPFRVWRTFRRYFAG